MRIRLKKGDVVRVRWTGRQEWINGKVVLASENGKSVAVELETPVARAGRFTAKYLPLSLDETGRCTDLTGDEYELEVKDSSQRPD